MSIIKAIAFASMTATGFALAPARAKDAIDRDGHFVTKAGTKRTSLGRQVGERPNDKHVKKVLAMHREGLPLPADRSQRRPLEEHRYGHRSAGNRLAVEGASIQRIVRRLGSTSHAAVERPEPARWLLFATSANSLRRKARCLQRRNLQLPGSQGGVWRSGVPHYRRYGVRL
jgi:hypothetical protein